MIRRLAAVLGILGLVLGLGAAPAVGMLPDPTFRPGPTLSSGPVLTLRPGMVRSAKCSWGTDYDPPCYVTIENGRRCVHYFSGKIICGPLSNVPDDWRVAMKPAWRWGLLVP